MILEKLTLLGFALLGALLYLTGAYLYHLARCYSMARGWAARSEEDHYLAVIGWPISLARLAIYGGLCAICTPIIGVIEGVLWISRKCNIKEQTRYVIDTGEMPVVFPRPTPDSPAPLTADVLPRIADSPAADATHLPIPTAEPISVPPQPGSRHWWNLT